MQFPVFDNNSKKPGLRAKPCKKHHNWNIFLFFWDFEIWKVVAQKLSLPRPFVFWTQNGRSSLIFTATKKLDNIFSTKKNLILVVFCKFLFSDKLFLSYRQKCEIAFAFYPPSCQNLPKSDSLGGGKRTRLRVFDDNSKMTCLRAKTSKRHPSWNYFYVKKIFF